MSDDLSCPACGEDVDLRGNPITDPDGVPTGIRVTCEPCGTEWDRNDTRRCPRCGGSDLYGAPVAVIEKSRGTQLSIVSTRREWLCWKCDRDLIDPQRRSGTALMPDDLPTL